MHPDFKKMDTREELVQAILSLSKLGGHISQELMEPVKMNAQDILDRAVELDREQHARQQARAYLIPTIISFKNVQKTSCPPEFQEELEGTVAWSVELFCDTQDRGVTDKHGVTHYPKPLVLQDLDAADSELDNFIQNVRAEISRARSKFPGRRIMGLAFGEEMGEVFKALLDERAVNVYKECVQAACMAGRIALDGDESVDEWREQKGLDPVPMSRS